MAQRRDFLKMLSMSVIASVLPKVGLQNLTTEKIIISSSGYSGVEGIGVERMRIFSNGNVGLATTSPDSKFSIH